MDHSIKDTNKDASDLLQGLADLEEEVSTFDTDNRKGVLFDAKSHLEEALHELEDIEKRLRELETGVDETTKEVDDKQNELEFPDDNLADVA